MHIRRNMVHTPMQRIRASLERGGERGGKEQQGIFLHFYSPLINYGLLLLAQLAQNMREKSRPEEGGITYLGGVCGVLLYSVSDLEKWHTSATRRTVQRWHLAVT